MNLFKDKRGLEFKLAFYAIIAVSMIIIATGVWINEWNTTYDAGLNYDLQEYDKLDTISAQASKQRGNLSVSTSVQGEDFEGTSIRGVFGVINNIHAAFDIVFGNQGMIAAVTTRWKLPLWIRQGLATAMIIAITWALVAILFRLGRRST